MAQHAILRFEKHKGNPARPLEAHHERQKEQYASNPDIDTSRSKYNFHIVKPEGRYYHFIQSRIEQAGCRTRKDSTRFVDTLITASPEFFKGKSPKEIQAFFQRAADFLIGRVGRENIVSAVVHMDEKTPHLHLTFVPLTRDNRLCAKEIIGNWANLTKWQDDFHAYMVEKYPDLERGESASKTGRKQMSVVILVWQGNQKDYYQYMTTIGEHYLQAELRHFRAYQERETRVRKMRHDMRNHLLCLRELAENGKTEQIKEYLGELSGALRETEQTVYSGNEIADAIINEKEVLARAGGVRISLEGRLPEEITIKATDLCTIFANALDNALEAVKDLEEKWIDIRIRQQGRMLFITFRNPTEEEMQGPVPHNKPPVYRSLQIWI